MFECFFGNPLRTDECDFAADEKPPAYQGNVRATDVFHASSSIDGSLLQLIVAEKSETLFSKTDCRVSTNQSLKPTLVTKEWVEFDLSDTDDLIDDLHLVAPGDAQIAFVAYFLQLHSSEKERVISSLSGGALRMHNVLNGVVSRYVEGAQLTPILPFRRPGVWPIAASKAFGRTIVRVSFAGGNVSDVGLIADVSILSPSLRKRYLDQNKWSLALWVPNQPGHYESSYVAYPTSDPPVSKVRIEVGGLTGEHPAVVEEFAVRSPVALKRLTLYVNGRVLKSLSGAFAQSVEPDIYVICLTGASSDSVGLNTARIENVRILVEADAPLESIEVLATVRSMSGHLVNNMWGVI